MFIKKWKDYTPINEEISPRLPVKEEYWKRKGKVGKKVALYGHDDLDGIFCMIEMQKWLRNRNFEIVKYGILNYSDGWKNTTVDPELINIVLDFANMPGQGRDEHIDYYLDHHGLFTPEELEKYKNSPVQKKATSSAYEAVCIALGVPQDSLTVSVIDMVDSAKYTQYGISWQRLLDFNLSDIKNFPNKRLEFAAAFNQFLKRGDTKTLISVIYNCKDASIYSIFNVMKLVYPEHNVFPRSGQKKDFISDSRWRLGEMQRRTRGSSPTTKKIYNSLPEFRADFGSGDLISPDGYQMIGKLVFIPTGTWANALRARTIVERDFMDGILPEEPDFILLQYGGTLQVCSYKKMDQIENLPVLRSGKVVDDLGEYMKSVLQNFKTHLGYHNPDTSLGQDEITVSGGHGGIGSISNIFGVCDVEPYRGLKFIDMFKNKIISDLSGVLFNVGTKWSEIADRRDDSKTKELDDKVIKTGDITKIDRKGKVI